MEGSGEYDVFISYSRSKSEWVKKYLYSPLKDFTKPDGSKLKIFFDENEIGIGEHFTTKYMRSIIDSKLFIPVMSQDYYNKNHCRNEMDIAVKRKVEQLISIFMITFDYKYVPEEFNHINFVDLKKGLDFMPILEKELINQDDSPAKANRIDNNKKIEPVVDSQKGVSEKENKEQVEQSIIAKGDSLKLDDKTNKDSKKEKVDTIKVDEESNEVALIENKKNKKNKDKKNKKDKKSNMESEEKKKDKKKNKKLEKTKDKKKIKKLEKKKSKKKSDKKDKKEKKKKSKKRSEKKEVKKKSKKQAKKKSKKDKKVKKKGKKKGRKQAKSKNKKEKKNKKKKD
jgi:hypothetical protein